MNQFQCPLCPIIQHDTNVFVILIFKKTFLVFKNKTYTYCNNVQNEEKRKARLST